MPRGEKSQFAALAELADSWLSFGTLSRVDFSWAVNPWSISRRCPSFGRGNSSRPFRTFSSASFLNHPPANSRKIPLDYIP